MMKINYSECFLQQYCICELFVFKCKFYIYFNVLDKNNNKFAFLKKKKIQ